MISGQDGAADGVDLVRGGVAEGNHERDGDAEHEDIVQKRREAGQLVVQLGIRGIRNVASLSGIAPGHHQHAPFYYTFIKVEPKESDCCLSFRREGLDDRSLKDKMIQPTVAPRVEETHKSPSLRIESANVAPLPCIASKASVCEVVNF